MPTKPWFQVQKLPGDIYAILEPHHFQEVISYLLIGQKAALLLDTGAGLGIITDVISQLWSGEIIAINSHVHFDHVGDNHRFGEVLVYNHPQAVNRLKRGYTAAELAPHAKAELFEPGYICGFDPAGYCIPPSNPRPINDGHVIDLGGRKIHVLHTPGHSPDSIVLFDEMTCAIFTGDTYYPGHLYAHYKGEFYGESCLADYVKSMTKLAALPGVKAVHPGHNRPVARFCELQKAAAAVQALYHGQITARTLLEDLSIASLPNRGENIPGYIIPDELFVYEFDGVKIIASG